MLGIVVRQCGAGLSGEGGAQKGPRIWRAGSGWSLRRLADDDSRAGGRDLESREVLAGTPVPHGRGAGRFRHGVESTPNGSIDPG